MICTPLVGRTRADVLAELSAVLPKKPDLIEWRVDFFEGIGDTALVIDTARAMKASAGETPILFTRRSTREGGEKIALVEADVVKLYEAVCAARCVDMIDYEMCNDAADFARVRAASRANDIPLVASYHNFQSTPDAAFAGRQVRRGRAARRRRRQGRGDAARAAGRADAARRDLHREPDRWASR